MNEPSYNELKEKYMDTLELINDLSITLDKREQDIILLKTRLK